MTCIRPDSLHTLQELLSVSKADYLSLSKGSLGDYQRQYGLHHLAILEGATEVLKALSDLEILHSYVHMWEVWSQPLRLLRYVGLEKFESTIDVAQPVDDFRTKTDLAEFLLSIGLFRVGQAILSNDPLSLSIEEQREYWKWRGAFCIRLGQLVEGSQAYESWLALVDEDDLIERSEIYNDLGILEYYQRNFEPAVEYLERSLKIRRAELPENDERILSTMSNLGAVFHQQNQLGRSLDLSQEVLDIRTQLLPDKHPQLLSSFHNIGTLLNSLKKYGEARTHLEHALALRTEVLGTRHPARLKTQYALAIVYHALREWDLCESAYRENILLKTETLGIEHPETHDAKIGLVTAYRYQDKGEQAKEMLEDILESQQRLYGDAHTITLSTKEEYAALLYDFNDPNALSVLEAVLQNRLENFGAEHPDTLRTRKNLGGAYMLLDQMKQAEEQYQAIVTVCTASTSMEQLFVMQSKQDLATVLRMQLKYQESKTIWNSIYVWAKDDKARVYEKICALEEMAWCDVGLGVIEKSAKRFEKLRAVFKPTHWKHHYMQVGLNLCKIVQSGEWNEQALDPIRDRDDVAECERFFIERLSVQIQKSL